MNIKKFYLTLFIIIIIFSATRETNFLESHKEVQTPPTGIYQLFTSEKLIASFKIKNNTEGLSYLIKFKEINTKSTVLTLFLNKYETCDILVPLGTYEIITASGEKWYGNKLLFGKRTQYQKFDKIYEFYITENQINGWQIDLNERITGNLKLKDIKENEFI